jgi:hypothetical protein
MSKEGEIENKDVAAVILKDHSALSVAISTQDKGLFSIPDNIDIPQLSREIILASKNSPRISEIPKNYSGNEIKTYINRAVFEAGMKIEDLDKVIPIVVGDIFKDFGILTLPEIKLAYRLGVRGELGEFMGLNVRTFYVWVKNYKNTVRAKAMRDLLSIPPPKVKELPPPDSNLFGKYMFEAYATFVKTGVYNFTDYGNVFYNLLVRHSLIKLSYSEAKFAIMKSKREYVKNNSPADAKSSYQRKERKDTNDLIIRSYQVGNIVPRLLALSIKSNTKRLILKLFLSKCKDKNIDLVSFLETKNQKQLTK